MPQQNVFFLNVLLCSLLNIDDEGLDNMAIKSKDAEESE